MGEQTVHFAEITIPEATARQLASDTDLRTALDAAYAIKSALQESFGERVVRPWRLVSSANGLFRVVGVVGAPSDVAPTQASRRHGLSALVVPFALRDGDLVRMEVEATPVKNVRHRDPVTRRIVADHRLDITASRAPGDGRGRYVQASGADLELAYARWLTEQLSEAARGSRVVAVPDILDCTPAFRTRKNRGRPALVGISRVRARVEVAIADSAAFAGLLRHGLKRMKDVGLGSLIPCPVLEELAL